MELFPKNRLPLGEVKKFIVIFFAVGVLGFMLPWTHLLFASITPWALLMVLYLLAVYHEKYHRREWIAFGVIYLLGFGVEVAGVHTGVIFGSYHYEGGLGIELFETPLMIGLNWLFLSYSSCSIAGQMTQNRWGQLLIAPSLMLLYDLLLEQMAPHMQMWSWEGQNIPLRNYLAWWLIGFVCVAVLKLFRVNTRNPLASYLFFAQMLFFLLLFILNQ